MWWKKVLYFLLVIVLGFGITVLSGSINFNIQAKNMTKNYASNKQYDMVERLFCYVTPNQNQYIYSYDNNDNSHLDIYPSLVKNPYYIYYIDEGYVVKYDIIEEALTFSLFNIPSSFSLSDSNDKKGEIKLTLNNEKTIDLFFDNRDKEEGELNYYINFYSFVEQYYSLTAYITFDDYVKYAGNEEVKITNVTIIDGKGETYYQYNFDSLFNFSSFLHSQYKVVCKEYRDFMLEYGQTIAVGAYEEKDRLIKNIDKVTNDNPERFYPKPSTAIIFTTTSFILTISITLAAYLSVAIVVTRNIFFRKKHH